MMGSPGTNFVNALRYLPQNAIDGVLGPKWGPRVEGWMGMSPAPVEAPPPAVKPLPPEWEEANRRSAQQNLSTMHKPLKGK